MKSAAAHRKDHCPQNVDLHKNQDGRLASSRKGLGLVSSHHSASILLWCSEACCSMWYFFDCGTRRHLHSVYHFTLLIAVVTLCNVSGTPAARGRTDENVNSTTSDQVLWQYGRRKNLSKKNSSCSQLSKHACHRIKTSLAE